MNEEKALNNFIKNCKKRVALDLHQKGIEETPDEVEEIFKDTIEMIKKELYNKFSLEFNNFEIFLLLCEALKGENNKD